MRPALSRLISARGGGRLELIYGFIVSRAGRAVIVGAGPAGASLAYLLARRGVEVALLERHGDFARTFRVLKALECDLFLGAHGQYYDLANKYKRLGKGPNPFVDPAGYKEYIAEREQFYLYTLETQQKQ